MNRYVKEQMTQLQKRRVEYLARLIETGFMSDERPVIDKLVLNARDLGIAMMYWDTDGWQVKWYQGLPVVFPAGEYYIGDPCYVFEESWMRILDIADYFRKLETSEYKDFEFIGGSTFVGDGVYGDNYGHTYTVDSGSIALLPIGMLAIDKKGGEALGFIKKFEKDFLVLIENGIFKFGDIRINTQ